MRRLATWLVAVWLAVGAPLAAGAQEEPAPLFTTGDALLAGGILLGAAAVAPADRAIAGWIQGPGPQSNDALRAGADLFRVLGFPGSVGATGSLYLAGRLLDRPELASIGLHATEAIGVAVAATYLLKGLAGRARPFHAPDDPFDLRFGRGFAHDRYQSFPSGHTTAAFAAAAAVATELGYVDPELQRPVGAALFAAATLVGASRLYHDAHWASDAVGGAAIGAFAGWKVVRYHRTRPDDRVDRIFLSRLPAAATEGPLLVLRWSVPL